MKLYRIFWRNRYIGVQNRMSREIIIPAEFNKIEIYCDKYFDCATDNGRMVLNTDNQIIFDFNNQKLENRFIEDKVIYTITNIEQKGDTLIYYGENATLERIQFIEIVIHNNKLTKRLNEF